jgi:membrane fusion protein
MPLLLNGRLDELRSSLLNVERALAEAEAQQSVVVRAPIAGRVATLLAHAGMSASPERPLLAIIPIASELQAELLLPTHAAGFISEGQEVRLRYDAFPYQKFGLYRGRIMSVSRTVLNPEDQVGPVRLQVPAYRVVASLESQTVMAYGHEVLLQPGLTLRADVLRDRRRIIEWIFDPMIAAAKGI